MIYITTHTYEDAIEMKQWCKDNSVRLKASRFIGPTRATMVHVLVPKENQELLVKMRWNKP